MWKVSLLVTTYNVKEQAKITLDSIGQQDYPDIEVIIVDGKSQDGTLEVIRDFAEKYGQSGHDSQTAQGGGADKGHGRQRMCSGDVVAVCNDRFCTPDAVTKLVRAIEQGGRDCIGSHADLVYVEGERIIRTWHMGDGRLADGWLPGHPTLFLKRSVYEKYGVYDTGYRCAADYEFMVRFLKDEKNRLAYVPERLVSMFYGGTSNAGLRNYWVSVRESYMALRRHGVRHPLLIIFRRTVRVLRQF